ncbi:MAG TPA: hypothetical protein VFT04_14680 [Gemmatimonadales bacterium]|nr:hypothetical protein [Gemmatimonadales bacterium]
MTRPGALAAVGAVVATLCLAAFVWRRTGRRPIVPGPFRLGANADSLAVLYGAIPLVLALHLAVTLFVSGVTLHLFAPNLALGEPGAVPIGSLAGAVAALAQIGIGLALFYGALTRIAAALLLVLWLAGAAGFGPILLLEHAIVPGIALTLLITGRGPFAVDALLNPRLGLPRLRWLPDALTPLRIGTGLSLATLAFTEKLWNLPLGLAFLERYPVNFLPAWGIPLGDESFLLAAGAVELLAGLLLIANVYVRLGILVLWLPFNLTLAAFGWIELVGHLPIYGAMAVLALWGRGSGDDVRALQRGLMQRPALLPSPQPHAGSRESAP